MQKRRMYFTERKSVCVCVCVFVREVRASASVRHTFLFVTTTCGGIHTQKKSSKTPIWRYHPPARRHVFDAVQKHGWPSAPCHGANMAEKKNFKTTPVPPNSTSNSAETSSKNTIFLQGFGTIRGTIGTIRRYYFSAGIFFPREKNTVTTSPSPPPHCRHLRRCTAATFAAVMPPPPPPRYRRCCRRHRRRRRSRSRSRSRQ